MGQNTSRLGLYLPGGGSTGLITPDEPADIDKINDNMTKLDADAGAYVCTSSTRPATPYNGKIIFETDTRKTMIYKSATTSWEPVDSQGKIVANAAARDALFASPVQGTKVFRTDTGVTETYYAAWNASTNPGGKTPAGWYVAERSTGLVPIVPPTVAVSGGSATANSLGVISFSAATSLSLNGVFTSSYMNYRIIFNALPNTTPAAIHCRLRATSDNSTANYFTALYRVDSSGGSGVYTVSGQSYFNIGQGVADWTASASIDILSPREAAKTKLHSQVMGHNGGASSSYTGALAFSDTTQFDGITFYPSSGNFTGTVQVFGYNN